MLESFYEFIIKKLLLDYFLQKKINKGSRYCISIENTDYCNLFLKYIEKYLSPIKISGIYKGNNTKLLEKEFDTFELKPKDGNPGLIIGYDKYYNKHITEDYLTTLRNAIGIENTKLENYSILFVLSDSGLSSLVTASKDIQGVGYPLNAHYIIEKVKKLANGIFDEIRLEYFEKYLDKIGNDIDDKTSDIFAFCPALKIIEDGCLKGHYNELGFFEDESFCNRVFKEQNKNEITKRIQSNHDLYSKISNIMQIDDGLDESESIKIENKLLKYIDEKLAKKILADSEHWQNIPYEEFRNSQRRKLETETFEIVGELCTPQDNTSFIKNEIGDRKKKTVNYIVIYDFDSNVSQEIVANFNKSIKDFIICADSGYKIKNHNSISFFINEKYSFYSIGSGDNHHDFYILRIPKSKSFFETIGKNFVIKKTEIQIKFLEEMETLKLGIGSDKIDIYDGKSFSWSDDLTIELNNAVFEDYEKVTFNIDFNGVIQKIAVKLDSNSEPQLGPDNFPINKLYTWIDEFNDLEKVTDGEFDRGVRKYWRKFLSWEKSFVNNSCTTICSNDSEYCKNCENCINHIDNINCLLYKQLPKNVSDCFNLLCDYYKKKKTVPSLCPMDDTLMELYASYCNAVVDCIKKITNDRELAPEEYNLTRLGVVEENDRVYFSPFHPMIAAFFMELSKQFDTIGNGKIARRLLSPQYLIPYIFYSNDLIDSTQPFRTYSDCNISNIRNWVCYEKNTNKPQERLNNITEEVVKDRISEFIKNFDYLFQDKDCPIKISIFGMLDDIYVVKGIIEYLKNHYLIGIQKIELHEYVNNIKKETFFEKLNKANSDIDKIRMLKDLDIKLSLTDKYSEQDILNSLFTKVTVYKHLISEYDNNIIYSHISFYQMEPQASFVPRVSKKNRTELSLFGLISVPSTYNDKDAYYMCYGSKGVVLDCGYVYPMAVAMNSLYANEPNGLEINFIPNTCVAKKYRFDASNLLNSIYDNSNWVTFINPEVDINYFYNKNSNVYIVHYTDQYTINAKYDSITVTKHIDQYENMLTKTYDVSQLPKVEAKHFNLTMLKYFNCLNGSWLLNTVNKSRNQIREKMSIVATTIAMLRFMKRNKNIVWIPISLEEILRVSKSVGLTKEFIFSQSTLDIDGCMSDDLLMMGLESNDEQKLRLYIYPIEVKVSDSSVRNNPNSIKGRLQIVSTITELKRNLLGESNFNKNIYRTFFATQYLVTAEKLYANSLLEEKDYNFIENNRFALLNLGYELENQVPVSEMGLGAIVSFYNEDIYRLKKIVIDDISICEIHFEEEDCFRFVAGKNSNLIDFLDNQSINIDADTLSVNNIKQSQYDTKIGEEISLEPNFEPDSNNVLNTFTKNNISVEGGKKTKIVETINSNMTKSLNSDRILIGKDKFLQNVFWEFGSAKLANRHLLITGTSGQGKTYCIQSMLYELTKFNVPSVIIDYSNGFIKDKLEENFVEKMGNKLIQRIVKLDNVPINPFVMFEQDYGDGILRLESSVDVANRLKSIFSHVYKFGEQQESVVYDAVKSGLEKYGNKMNMNLFKEELENINNKYSNSVLSKLKPFLDSVKFDSEDNLDWQKIIYPDESQCYIFQLAGYDRDIQLVIAEILLWDLWNYSYKFGKKDKPFVVVLDEAQNLSHKKGSPTEKILTEGRKFGWSACLATQSLQILNDEEISRLLQSAVKLYFKPIETELLKMSKQLDIKNYDIWFDQLKKLEKSQCIVVGDKYDSIGNLITNNPIKVTVSALENR